MNDFAIQAEGLWKKFRRGEMHDSLRDAVPALVRKLLRRGSQGPARAQRDFWALQDISLELRRGEALGVIGPNGAGKSTLFKILARIIKPTAGHYRVSGRLAALIEVAAGFHPDLTGRENIYLNAAILGMRRRDIARRLDEIIAFSGIERFIDTPVKRYSSGMQTRLGFSVAVHMDPDVLLLDEVLSVGDLSFQQRCFSKLQEVLQAGGAVVFVSHNLQAVAQLCSRCLVLSQGRVLYNGEPEDALAVYLKAAQAARPAGPGEQAGIVLRQAVLRQADGEPGQRLRPHAPCELIVALDGLEHVGPCHLGLAVERTKDLLSCYDASTAELGLEPVQARAGQRLTLFFRFMAHFTRGHYRINLTVRDAAAGESLAHFDNVASFVVEEAATCDGVVDIDLSCTAEVRARTKECLMTNVH